MIMQSIVGLFTVPLEWQNLYCISNPEKHQPALTMVPLSENHNMIQVHKVDSMLNWCPVVRLFGICF